MAENFEAQLNVMGAEALLPHETDPMFLQLQEEANAPADGRPLAKFKEVAAPAPDDFVAQLAAMGAEELDQPTLQDTRAEKRGEFAKEHAEITDIKGPGKQAKQQDFLDRYLEFEADDKTAEANAKTRQSFAQEFQLINETIKAGTPERDIAEKDFVDRYVDFESDERARVLKYKLGKLGVAVPREGGTWQALRRTDEAMQRLGSTALSGVAWATGQGDTADYITSTMNDLNEYNNLLDRHTVLGKKYGPLFGQIGSSLVGTTVSTVATGGLMGMASILAMDDFNRGMEETKDRPADERWTHAAAKSAITFGTTVAGGALAKKMGVASGETVIPLVGSVSKALFTRAGLTKMAIAGITEGGEEGVQALLGNIEDYRSGVNPDAMDTMFDDIAQGVVIGAAVGSGAQVATGHIGQLDLEMSHTTNLIKGWVKRLRKADESRPDGKGKYVPRKEYDVDEDGNLVDVPAKRDVKPKASTDTAVSEYVVSPDGAMIRTKDLDAEIEAIGHLQDEIDAQRKSSPSKESDQLMIDRKVDIDSTDTEIDRLQSERAELTRDTKTSDKSSRRVDEINNRLLTLSGYKEHLQELQAKDTEQFLLWDKKSTDVYNSEMEFVDSEFDRVEQLYLFPDTATKAKENLERLSTLKENVTKSDEKTKRTEAQVQSEDVSTTEKKELEVRDKENARMEEYAAELDTLNALRDETGKKNMDAVPGELLDVYDIRHAELERLHNSIADRKRDIEDMEMGPDYDKSTARVQELKGLNKVDQRKLKALKTIDNKKRAAVVRSIADTKKVMKAERKQLQEDYDALQKKYNTEDRFADVVRGKIDRGEYADAAVAKFHKDRETRRAAKAGKKGAKGRPQDSATAPPTYSNAPKRGPSQLTDKTIYDGLHKSMLQGRQQDVKFLRKFLGLDAVEARKAMATDEAFVKAKELKFDETAYDLARDVLSKDRRILDGIELAGVQTRYVEDMVRMHKELDLLNENGDSLSQEAYDARSTALDTMLDDLDVLTAAWIKSSSEAGAALQAQKRVYGFMFSPERALIHGRRNKGMPLTKEEVETLNAASNGVKNAAAELETKKELKGTEEYDRADHRLTSAQMEYKGAIANLRPGSATMDAIEKYNAVSMALNLAGDFVPFGRQGFVPLVTHPIKSFNIAKDFFKVFNHRTAAESEFAAFKVERGLKEMANYKTLTTKYNVRQLDAHTAFSDMEGAGLSRMVKAFSGRKKGKRTEAVVGAVSDAIGKTPLKNYDIAYRAWLNSVRMQMADTAYRDNQYLLDKPGGELEMKKIIGVVMNATGHTDMSMGKFGQVTMTAPRWLLSRVAIPAKAPKHLVLGSIDMMRGRKSASRYVARQYVRGVMGAGILSGMLEGVAMTMFGDENVSLDRNPISPTFGLLKVNGRAYDVTGGMAFVIRQLNKGRKGLREGLTGPDKERDSDVAKSYGSTLVSRFSPVARDASYAYQSFKPINEDEYMAPAEYLLRKMTFLTWQEMYDAAKDEGYSMAAFSAVLEHFGMSGHESKR